MIRSFGLAHDRTPGDIFECDFAKAGLGRGRLWSIAEDDRIVNVVDVHLDRSVRVQNEALEDVLLIRANVGSASTFTTSNGSAWNFMRPAITVSFLPKGARLDVVMEPTVAHTAVTLLLKPKAILERYGLRREELPAALLSVVDGRLCEPTMMLSLPLKANIASLIDDLLRSQLPGRLRGLQASARTLEMFVLILSAWKESSATPAQHGLRSRDAELVASARRILLQRLANPPTLQELAHELGTNRNKLNQIFQRGMGITPKAFCVQRRIERAQALLHEGRLNVAQIAEVVGYQHQSSFASAFREVVGVCPRAYGRANVDVATRTA